MSWGFSPLLAAAARAQRILFADAGSLTLGKSPATFTPAPTTFSFGDVTNTLNPGVVSNGGRTIVAGNRYVWRLNGGSWEYLLDLTSYGTVSYSTSMIRRRIVSADGTRVLVINNASGTTAWSIKVLFFDGSSWTTETTLTDTGYKELRHVALSADGSTLYVLFGNSGLTAYYVRRYKRTGSTWNVDATTLDSLGSTVSELAVSGDGTYYSRAESGVTTEYKWNGSSHTQLGVTLPHTYPEYSENWSVVAVYNSGNTSVNYYDRIGDTLTLRFSEPIPSGSTVIVRGVAPDGASAIVSVSVSGVVKLYNKQIGSTKTSISSYLLESTITGALSYTVSAAQESAIAWPVAGYPFSGYYFQPWPKFAAAAGTVAVTGADASTTLSGGGIQNRTLPAAPHAASVSGFPIRSKDTRLGIIRLLGSATNLYVRKLDALAGAVSLSGSSAKQFYSLPISVLTIGDTGLTQVDRGAVTPDFTRMARAYDNISGAVYVKSGGTWSLEQTIVGTSTSSDRLGWHAALSSDGAHLLMGAPGFSSTNGAVFYFTRSGSTWTQQQKITVGDGALNDWFGYSVVMTPDAATAVVSAPFADANGDSNAGKVYVFTRSGSTWSLQDTFLGTANSFTNGIGGPIALSHDGNTLAIGEPTYSDVFDSSAYGRIRILTRSGSVWSQQQQLLQLSGQLKLGGIVALSGDGNTLVASAKNEWRIYKRVTGTWSLIATITAPFGSSYLAEDTKYPVSVSYNGDKVLLGDMNSSSPFGVVLFKRGDSDNYYQIAQLNDATISTSTTPWVASDLASDKVMVNGKLEYRFLATRSISAAGGEISVSGQPARTLYSKAVKANAGAATVAGAAAKTAKSYTFPALAGSISISGAAAKTVVGRKVVAALSAVAVSGRPIKITITLNATSGALAVSGTATKLAKSIIPQTVAGALTITGADAFLVKVASNKLDAAPIGYTISGAAAKTTKTTKFTASSSSFSISGAPAVLKVGKLIVALPGTFSVAGQAAQTRRASVLRAAPAAEVVAGAAAKTTSSRRLSADAAALSLAGSAATGWVTRRLDAQSGAVSVGGLPATMSKSTEYLTAPGVLTIGTGPVGIWLYAERLLNLEPGSFSVGKVGAGLSRTQSIGVDGRSLTVSGFPSRGSLGKHLGASAGALSLLGSARLTKNTVLGAAFASAKLSGAPAGYRFIERLHADAGSITLSGWSNRMWDGVIDGVSPVVTNVITATPATSIRTSVAAHHVCIRVEQTAVKLDTPNSPPGARNG